MATPHITAEFGDIAKTVLMPGDPLRAKYIAETYLENPVLFNSVRNMFGYTGTYKGQRVSVMGSGMGMGSIGIYSYELYKFYGVENIIRIGSAGAYTEQLNLYDVMIVDSCWSESTFAEAQAGLKEHMQYPSEHLVKQLEDTALLLQMKVVKGRAHSSNVFYHEDCVPSHDDIYREHGCLCVEMETYALFHNAHILNKQAAALLTISDSLVTHEGIDANARQLALNNMIELALESCLA